MNWSALGWSNIVGRPNTRTKPARRWVSCGRSAGSRRVDQPPPARTTNSASNRIARCGADREAGGSGLDRDDLSPDAHVHARVQGQVAESVHRVRGSHERGVRLDHAPPCVPQVGRTLSQRRLVEHEDLRAAVARARDPEIELGLVVGGWCSRGCPSGRRGRARRVARCRATPPVPRGQAARSAARRTSSGSSATPRTTPRPDSGSSRARAPSSANRARRPPARSSARRCHHRPRPIAVRQMACASEAVDWEPSADGAVRRAHGTRHRWSYGSTVQVSAAS